MRDISSESRGLGWRIQESVEDTKLSTNKQHSLSAVLYTVRGIAAVSCTRYFTTTIYYTLIGTVTRIGDAHFLYICPFIYS